MGYMHIENLYRDQTILMFKECWALEKIHGTSAHISWKSATGQLHFSAGGCSHERFVGLFDQQGLIENFSKISPLADVTIYGEAYGASILKMGKIYGDQLRFIAFDVNIDNHWLSVPNAHEVATGLGLDFVDYVKISTDMAEIDAQRDRPSVQAVRNGMGEHQREGVVLKPLIELTKNNGDRIVCKHKHQKYMETATPREVSPERLVVLEDAQQIAIEWVTQMRLLHVIDKLGAVTISDAKKIIEAMLEDVLREASGEIVVSPEVKRAIATMTMKQFNLYERSKVND